MRVLAVLLLVANVLFFVWRFNAQLQDDLAARQHAPPAPPVGAPALQLLRELPELPPLRELPPELAASVETSPAQPVEDVATSAPSIADSGEAEPAATLGENPDTAPAPDAAQTSGPSASTPAASEDATALVSPPTDVAPATTASADATVSTLAPQTSSPGTVADQTAANAPEDTETAAPAGDYPPVAPPATVPAALVPSGVCVRIGPYARDSDALRLSRWLRPRSSRLVIRHEGSGERPLFGIYLEPRSERERDQNLRDLASQGVHDVLPVRREGMSHAISLGVFSSQENVNRRLAEIEKQGYRPIVVPRRDVGGSRYIEAELATGFDDPARLPAAELGGAAVKPVSCRP